LLLLVNTMGWFRSLGITVGTIGLVSLVVKLWRNRTKEKYLRKYSEAKVPAELQQFVETESVKIYSKFAADGLVWSDMYKVYDLAVESLQDACAGLSVEEQKNAVVLLTWKVIDIHDFPLIPDSFIDPIMKDIFAGLIEAYYLSQQEGWSGMQHLFDEETKHQESASERGKKEAEEAVDAKVSDVDVVAIIGNTLGPHAKGAVAMQVLMKGIPALVLAAYVPCSSEYDLANGQQQRVLAKRLIRQYAAQTTVQGMPALGEMCMDKIIASQAGKLVGLCLKGASKMNML
jgi:hypothetical protein